MTLHRIGRTLAALGLVAVLLGVSPGKAAFSVLQMNLCNSGWAGCYTGHSVAEAAAVIRDSRPDVVTLNEICREDAEALGAAVGAAHFFQPAIDRRVGRPILCRDGSPYGIGLLVRRPVARATSGDTYPVQDPVGPEGRAWLCAAAARGFVACTTHLVSANPLIALAQCRYFFTTVAAAFKRPVVVGGDFNLGNLSTCRPADYVGDDDGGLQHVAILGAAGQHRARVIDMAGTTDHPALLVALRSTSVANPSTSR